MNKALGEWLVPVVIFLLAGCAKTVSWQEEVQLSDGRVIVVERETLRAPGGDDLAHGGSGTTPKERRIRFEYPPGSGQYIEWRSTKVSPSIVPEIPLVLEVHEGTPIVLAIVAISAGCEAYTRYAYVDGKWLEESLPEKFEKAVTNLYLKSSPSMPSFVDLAMKHKENSDIRYFRTLKQAGPRRIVCGG